MNAEQLSLALQAVKDIKTYADRGDQPLAQSARRTLDEVCWSPEGYPPAIERALRARGLRHTAD